MRRNLFSVVLLLTGCISAISQDALEGKKLSVDWFWIEDGKQYAGPSNMSFKNGEMRIAGENYTDGNEFELKWKYSIRKDYVYTVLQVKGKEWLVIPYDDRAVLFLDEEFGWTAYASDHFYEEWIPDYRKITATSYLTEMGVEYKPENLKGGPPDLPWASGNGYGIGDRIELTGISRTRALLLLNGYISSKKRYLYGQNSRVKRIRVTSLETNISKELLLKDLPEFQKIEIADLFPNKNSGGETVIRITVLEVYPGSKYKDLCIYRLVPDFTDR